MEYKVPKYKAVEAPEAEKNKIQEMLDYFIMCVRHNSFTRPDYKFISFHRFEGYEFLLPEVVRILNDFGWCVEHKAPYGFAPGSGITVS